jgi:hypothetical protein
MPRVFSIAAVIISLVFGTFSSAVTSTPALAQGEPPPLGDVVVEDALAAPGLSNAYTCSTGRVTRQFANDGLTITASGGCQDPGGFAGSGIDGAGTLKFVDGEFRTEFRQLAGLDKTQFGINVRISNQSGQSGFSGYYSNLNVTRGTLNFGVSVNGQGKSLGQRNDLASLLKPDDWNTMAVRAQGPNFWVFVNDSMVLAVTDASLDSGFANALVSRVGQPNAADTLEISGALRNVKVSDIAGGDDARRTAYTPPPPVVTASAVPCTQPTAVANDVKMNPPGDGVDPALAKLAGPWEGVWDADGPNPLPSRLYVEQFDGPKVTVVYTWGDQPAFNGRAGWQRIAADVTPEGKITWGTTVKFTFWAADDKVEGLRETPQATMKATYARCP